MQNFYYEVQTIQKQTRGHFDPWQKSELTRLRHLVLRRHFKIFPQMFINVTAIPKFHVI